MDGASVRFYSLYGLTVVVRCKGKGISDQVDQLFTPFPFTKLAKVNNSDYLDLYFTNTEIPAKIPDTASKYNSWSDVLIFEDGNFVYITDGSSVFHLHPHEGTGYVTLHHSFKEKSSVSKHNLFLISLIHLFSHRGLYDLHAAGLVRDGIGYLFLGDSGCGKSSITLSLVRKGWYYISDDALLIKSSTDEVVVLNFRRKFYLDPVLRHHYPEIVPHLEEPINVSDNKRILDVESVYPDQFCPKGLPKVMVFTNIVDKPESMLSPIDRTHALVKLMRQSASIFFNRQSSRAHLEILKRLVYQTDSYQLLAGRDLYDEPEKITEVLSEISPKTS